MKTSQEEILALATLLKIELPAQVKTDLENGLGGACYVDAVEFIASKINTDDDLFDITDGTEFEGSMLEGEIEKIIRVRLGTW